MSAARPPEGAPVRRRMPGAVPTLPMATYLRRLVLLAVLPLLLLAVVLAADSLRRLRAADDRNGQQLAARLAGDVDDMLHQRVVALQMLADSPLLDAQRLADFHRRAQVFRARLGSDLLLADRAGHMLLHTGVSFGAPLPPMPRPAGRAALPLALDGQAPAVGDLFIGPINKRQLAAVAVPVLRAGHAEQALLTSIEVRLFQQVVERALVPDGWSVAVVDSSGAVVAGRFGPGSSLQAVADGGDRHQLALRQAPWRVVVDQSPASRRGPVLMAGAGLLAAIAAATVAGLLAGHHGGRRLTQAMQALSGNDGGGGDATAATPGPLHITEVQQARDRLAASDQQRERALQALRRSQAQLATLVLQAPHGMAMLDRALTVLAASRRWTQWLGGGRDDLAGQRLDAALPDQPAAWPAACALALDGQAQTCDGEPWRRADGQTRWLSWVVQPWTDDHGTVAGVIISCEDITERQQAVRELQQAHERFATVFESAPVAMAAGDFESTRFAMVNHAFVTLTGYPREQLLNRSSADFGLWIDPAFRAATHARLREQGQVDASPGQLRRSTGEVIEVALSCCRIDIAGRPHFVAMLVDTTLQAEARRALTQQQGVLADMVAQRTAELEQANAMLAERAAAIADLYDGAPCGYHSISPDGVVMSVNNTELGMLGYARDEFVGQPIERFFTPESRVLFHQRYAQFRVNGNLRDAEFDIVCKDGRVLPVLVSAVTVHDSAGRHVGSRAVMVDNSERRQREAQIVAMQAELARRADEAEAANRAKSVFLANMSHEIRTPMNAILGLTHLMQRDSHEPLQRSRLTKVDTAARHLLQVINDILDLSKIEAGKMVLEQVGFSLDDVIGRAFEMVEDQAHDKGLELVLDTDHVPDRLLGDPTRLSQALINLLANAVKFTSQGWVRLGVALLAREGSAVHLRFEVGDTGEGIAPQALTQLFDAFEQADGSTTRRHGGTGLGLALTRHIARLMGGEVGVHSTPGEGSRFWFTARLGEAAPAALAARPVAGRRVLLVDDLPEALQALRDRLQQFGLQVSAFADPQQAWQVADAERLAGRPHDLLVFDWRMGPPDGVELLRLLRARHHTAPAVLVTASDDDRLRRDAEAAGFAAVLVKPITGSALYDALTRLNPGTGAAAASPWQPARAADDAETRLRRQHPGRRVLLAEDNPINREVAAELLHAAGLAVEMADNGEQAVAMALDGHFDLVLMDMQMPVLDGLDATRRLRAAGRGDLPIVAMTANAFGEDRAACLAAGMNDHVAKPVDPQQLYDTLLRWMPLPVAVAAPADPAPLPAAGSLPLPDRLATVEGFDVSQALQHVGGQLPVLRRVLDSFVRVYRGGSGMLDAERAHSLHGACSAVGAVALQAALQDYETTLAQGPGAGHLAALLAEQAGSIDGQLRRLADELGTVLSTSGD